MICILFSREEWFCLEDKRLFFSVAPEAQRIAETNMVLEQKCAPEPAKTPEAL